MRRHALQLFYGTLLILCLGLAVMWLSARKEQSGSKSHDDSGGAPASIEVENALRKTLTLIADAEEQRTVKEGHQAWASSRAIHCKVLGKMEDPAKVPGQPSAAEACYAAMDKQRVEALRDMRIPLLLAQRPQSAVGQLGIGLAIALDKNRMPDGVAVAGTGWLAALGMMEGPVELYDLATSQRLRSFGAEKYSSNLAFSANARLLFTGSRQVRGLKIWDVHAGDLLKELNEVTGPFVLSPDNRSLFFSNAQHGLGVYDLVAGRMVGMYYAAGGSLRSLAIDDAGKRIAANTHDGILTVWEVVAGRHDIALLLSKIAEARVPSGEQASAYAFSVDGAHLFAATPQSRIEKWSVRDLQRQESLQLGRIVAGRVERLPGSDVLALPLQSAPGSDVSVLVVDPALRRGILLDQGPVGRTIIAPVPGRHSLIAATQRDLRSIEYPEVKQFKPLVELFPPIPETASRPSKYGGTSLPMLKDLPQNARIEAIGVYEGPRPAGADSRSGAARFAGTVQVLVGSTDRPLVLVFSSYEPVTWSISPSAGASIKHILLSGPRESEVVGVRDLEITRMSGAVAYRFGSDGYARLDLMVRQYVGRSIERFQGS
ncbi:MAG: hypothetical protein NTW68_02225, partial [candidate division NC10 bacterium]|nr:hypothetical protein [candidate division NC10 bacterium]